MAVSITNSFVTIEGTGGGRFKIGKKSFCNFWRAHRISDPLTSEVEKFAREYVRSNFARQKTHLFVRYVCAWGGLRQVNFQRLKRYGEDDGFANVRNALKRGYERSASGAYDEAMEALNDVPGTGVSFRSKFLRFLHPDNAAVLDSIIRRELGYRESEVGYRQFVEDCRDIRNNLNIDRSFWPSQRRKWRIADVEGAIFMRVQLT